MRQERSCITSSSCTGRNACSRSAPGRPAPRRPWRVRCGRRRQGHIDTIDPYGGERCPPIIASFPPELRELVTFRAENSATYFDRAMTNNAYYDFVLVDGNHEYEFALFDVMCAARAMRPGGLMVMDNIEQIGPRLAAKTFLERNPDWRDVADVVRHIDHVGALQGARRIVSRHEVLSAAGSPALRDPRGAAKSSGLPKSIAPRSTVSSWSSPPQRRGASMFSCTCGRSTSPSPRNCAASRACPGCRPIAGGRSRAHTLVRAFAHRPSAAWPHPPHRALPGFQWPNRPCIAVGAPTLPRHLWKVSRRSLVMDSQEVVLG